MEEIIAAFSQDEAELLDFGVSDEASEKAGCEAKEGGAVTLAFCSGLDTCPA